MLDQAAYTPRLKSEFQTKIKAAMKEEFAYKNVMQIPRLDKIVLNMGVGEAVKDTKKVKQAAEELTLIAGQKAEITKARKAIANFKTRIGVKVGCHVTLRGDRMWAFLDKLIYLAVPRIKDFRGLSPKGFDKQGNYNMGLREQALFQEIVLDKLEHNQGLNITICFRNSTGDLSREVLKSLHMPFREK